MESAVMDGLLPSSLATLGEQVDCGPVPDAGPVSLEVQEVGRDDDGQQLLQTRGLAAEQGKTEGAAEGNSAEQLPRCGRDSSSSSRSGLREDDGQKQKLNRARMEQQSGSATGTKGEWDDHQGDNSKAFRTQSSVDKKTKNGSKPRATDLDDHSTLQGSNKSTCSTKSTASVQCPSTGLFEVMAISHSDLADEGVHSMTSSSTLQFSRAPSQAMQSAVTQAASTGELRGIFATTGSYPS
jgi:hypothetical protein